MRMISPEVAPSDFITAMLIHLLLQVRVHGHAHADRTHDQRNQAHQAQETPWRDRARRDDGMRLAEIRDRRFRQRALDRRSHFLNRRRAGIQLEQDTVARSGCRSASARFAPEPRATSSCADRCSGFPDRRSGSEITAAATRKSCPPTRIFSPTFTPTRISRSSPATTESGVSACCQRHVGIQLHLAVVGISRRDRRP